ncbi:hypothetical protein CHH91_04660 [Virgibacillus sp. 7505]|uniref:XkdX family protein n=1 Tax=Virgibacillus sp. 7505 TaxID=2022548 RepID=UPI000BA577A1|nr:XkdX family protein [Virgibacillus sp. 7505]PAE17301.1 hypothetical protein CHH91_04660 [Virgibacillus sp. 7505]
MAKYEEWEFHINDVDAFIWWYKDDKVPSIEDLRLFYEVSFLTDQNVVDGVYYTFLTAEEYKYITGKDYEGPAPIEPRPLPQPAPPVTDWEGPLVQPSPDDAPEGVETPEETETPIDNEPIPEEPERDPAEEVNDNPYNPEPVEEEAAEEPQSTNEEETSTTQNG